MFGTDTVASIAAWCSDPDSAVSGDKVTLDHNCIIHLANRTATGQQVNAIVRDAQYDCYVVNIGASEMLERGVRPDNYETFENLLRLAEIADIPRLDPLLILDVTFWDRCVWSSAELDAQADAIYDVLFGNSSTIDIAAFGLESSEGRQWVNRMCDVQGIWCHLRNANDIFLTTDDNFRKESKLPKLIALGVGKILRPGEL